MRKGTEMKPSHSKSYTVTALAAKISAGSMHACSRASLHPWELKTLRHPFPPKWHFELFKGLALISISFICCDVVVKSVDLRLGRTRFKSPLCHGSSLDDFVPVIPTLPSLPHKGVVRIQWKKGEQYNLLTHWEQSGDLVSVWIRVI